MRVIKQTAVMIVLFMLCLVAVRSIAEAVVHVAGTQVAE